MTDIERKVLAFLAADLADDFGYYRFSSISAETRLNRKQVRRACRALKRKGFAEYGRGLWTEDGEPAGSGYRATKSGADQVAR
jgi:hypothetical protein